MKVTVEWLEMPSCTYMNRYLTIGDHPLCGIYRTHRVEAITDEITHKDNSYQGIHKGNLKLSLIAESLLSDDSKFYGFDLYWTCTNCNVIVFEILKLK